MSAALAEQPAEQGRAPTAGMLPTPAELAARVPATSRAKTTVDRARREIEAVIHGRDDRLLAIVGPCSIHDPEQALEYAWRLLGVQHDVGDRLLVLMRVYLEKPRTRLGWPGLIPDPAMDGSGDMARGLLEARRLLVRLADLGLPAATEFLDPNVGPYTEDLVAWAAIGARTSESQPHRQMASGLPMPVGFKNGTDGSPRTAVDAMVAAGRPSTRSRIDSAGRLVVQQTAGNPAVHLVVRGGRGGPNYDRHSLASAAALIREAGIRPAVIVDCSHGNSGRDPNRQPLVLRTVLRDRHRAETGLVGFMLESHLAGGCGSSLTDPCLSWAETERLLAEAWCKAAPRGETSERRERTG